MKMSRMLIFVLTTILVLGALGIAMAKGKGKNAGGGHDGTMDNYVKTLPAEDVSPAEKEGLIFMYEEEKLARDVYSALHAQWGDMIFSNIASSEQQHMDSIKALLIKYDLPVPAAVPGEFEDTEMAGLYAELTDAGKDSLAAALQMGATIEDLDIADLQKFLEETDSTDIRIVYQNLMKGSRNHLRSFNARLEALGQPYEAQFLSADEVRVIVESDQEKGMVGENGQPM